MMKRRQERMSEHIIEEREDPGSLKPTTNIGGLRKQTEDFHMGSESARAK